MSNYPTGFQNASMYPTAAASGDTIGSWTGYNAPMASGIPNFGSYNFSNAQYPVTSSTPNMSSNGNTGANNAAPQASGSNPLQTVLGGVQLIGGLVGMNKLNKEKFPEYTASPELQMAKTRSGQMSKMGYTPEQRGSFNATMGQMLNQDYLNTVGMAGGNLAQAANARRAGMRLGALNQFAQGDAAQRMSNIRYDDNMTDKLQRLRDMNTQVSLQRRMALEQAYGGAIKTGTENIVNSFDMGTAMKMMAGGM